MEARSEVIYVYMYLYPGFDPSCLTSFHRASLLLPQSCFCHYGLLPWWTNHKFVSVGHPVTALRRVSTPSPHDRTTLYQTKIHRCILTHKSRYHKPILEEKCCPFHSQETIGGWHGLWYATMGGCQWKVICPFCQRQGKLFFWADRNSFHKFLGMQTVI